jgi:hypothetical protein
LTKGSHDFPKKFKNIYIYIYIYIYEPSKVLYGRGSPISFFLEKNYMKAVKPSKILHGPGGATLPYNPCAAVPAAGLY